MEKKILLARDYRLKAAKTIKPMTGDFAVVYFIYGLLMAAIGLFSLIPYAGAAIISLITLFTVGAFELSFIVMSNNAYKKNNKPKLVDLFSGFKRYTQALGVSIITGVFTFLWMLLLIVPGIIKSFAYSQSMFIANDNPNMSTLDCITESRRLMTGHKWKLFCLQISYIGWFILVILTLGILSFWVMPKYNMAKYHFYLSLKK